MAQLHHSMEELQRTRSPAHIGPKPNMVQVVTVQCLEELQRTCKVNMVLNVHRNHKAY